MPLHFLARTVAGSRPAGRTLILAHILGALAGAAIAEVHTVTIVSDYENLRFAFEPAVLTIRSGDTVVWVNDVDEEHNIITYPGGFPEGAGRFQSAYLQKAGDSFSHTFSVAGTYQYHCLPHLLMAMTGEIVVESRSDVEDFHEPSRAEILAYRRQLLEWFDEDDNLMEVRRSDKPGRQGD